VREGYDEGVGLESGRVEPLIFEDSLPTRYTATQRIRQWTPQVNRTFSLEPPESVPEFHWGRFGLRDCLDAGRNATVPALLYGERGRTGGVYVFHRRDVRCVRAGPSAAHFATGGSGAGSLLARASVRPSKGFFHVVSHISPNGAPDFEDLAILDPDDADQALVAVVEQVGNDIYVYRCLYREGE
jgi:hypothetical protein